MPIHELPPFTILETFLAWIEVEESELLPTCRWLILGDRLGPLILPEAEPSAMELTSLLRLLRDTQPSLLSLGEELATGSQHYEAAWIELCVDELLEYDGWHHPTQVLERPRPDLDKLLAACRERRASTPPELSARIEDVVFKVERAARIAGEARATRERHRRRSRRGRSQSANGNDC